MGLFGMKKKAVNVTETHQLIDVLGPGTPRNDFPGFVGMRIRVGKRPIFVTEIGRMNANIGTCKDKHILKIVKHPSAFDYHGSEVLLTSGIVGEYTWGKLREPIELKPNHEYDIVSYEWAGGDYWYHTDAVTFFTPDVICEGSVYFGGGVWNKDGSSGTVYGPVNIRYYLG